MLRGRSRTGTHQRQARNNIGAVLKDTGDLDRAISHFELSLKLDPTYGEAASNLGGALGTLGQHEKAIAAFRLALSISPDFSPAMSNLLMMRMSMRASIRRPSSRSTWISAGVTAIH